MPPFPTGAASSWLRRERRIEGQASLMPRRALRKCRDRIHQRPASQHCRSGASENKSQTWEVRDPLAPRLHRRVLNYNRGSGTTRRRNEGGTHEHRFQREGKKCPDHRRYRRARPGVFADRLQSDRQPAPHRRILRSPSRMAVVAATALTSWGSDRSGHPARPLAERRLAPHGAGRVPLPAPPPLVGHSLVVPTSR